MLKTQEADIIQLGWEMFDQVENEPGVRLLQPRFVAEALGGAIYPAGQHYRSDLEYPWPRGLPWIGDPDDPASMESARNVRKAMSYAIDRDALNDVTLGGRGCLQYQFRIDTCSAIWDDKWATPYDPSKAKELLTKAGYPNGFEFTFFIPSGFNATMEEVGEAVVPMWEAVGLKATIQKMAYSARRPEMLARTLKDVWIFIQGGIQIPDMGLFTMIELGGEGVWNMGAGWPESLEFGQRLLAEPDIDKQWAIIREWLGWLYIEQPAIQTVTWIDPWIAGPKIASWEMPYYTPRWPGFAYNAEPAR